MSKNNDFAASERARLRSAGAQQRRDYAAANNVPVEITDPLILHSISRVISRPERYEIAS